MIDRESGTSARNRVLRRRVLLGAGVAAAFLWAIWDAWGPDRSVFVNVVVGTLVLIAATAALGLLAGGLLRWLRRRRERPDDDSGH